MSTIIYWCDRQARRVRYGQFLRESRSIVRARTPFLLQLTGSEHANGRDAIGRRHRMAKDPGQFYRMIEAIETSPLESLYDRVLRLDDRVLRLEQEISALKRNLPIGCVDHE